MSCIRTTGTVRELGGKAHALAQLDAAGLPVPEWLVVAPSAFELSLSHTQREAWESGGIDALRAQIETLEPARRVAAEIGAAIAVLPACRFAVRSSASDEDGAQASFAGQLASYLFVEPAAVLRRVADVWRSAFTPQILEYRERHGLSGMPSPPAVLVQRMIDSTCSGVAFSADPVSGRRGLSVVSAVFGIGTALVGGEADADVYEVNRDGAIERKQIALKNVMHSFCSRSTEGVSARQVPESMRDEPVLTDAQALAVAALSRQAAAIFGQPQDIEWAIAGGKLYILQSRPITTLRNVPDPDSIVNIWDNSNIIESYSGVTTPLTFSFARHVYEGVYRQFCHILRVPPKKIAANERTFASMLGLIRGRIYYNLLNWYRVLALLPGFLVNRRFMEQMMGVREALPEEVVASLDHASRRERAADLLSLARMVFALLWNLFRLEHNIARFRARLNDALREPSPPLTAMRLDELTVHYAQLEAKLLQHWDAPLVNDFFVMIFHGALRKLTAHWLSDENGAMTNEAIRAVGEMVSAEPAARVSELAAIASADPEFVRCLCDAPMIEVLRAVRAHSQFRAPYDAYLDKFGDRCLEELKLESETLHENPEILLRSIGQLARVAQSGSPQVPTGDLGHTAEPIRSVLSRSTFKRLLFAWVLREARARVLQRENLRFERTRLFGRIRRIFREAGRRLHADGILESPNDVFYLQIDEIHGFVNGTAVTTKLAEIAAQRKAEFAEYRSSKAPPDRLVTTGPVSLANLCASPSPRTAPDTTAEEHTGIGCCRGVVRGRARVILDPRAAQLPAGSILVAEHTDPGWIMLFPSAKGLLVERGSLLSHSAIVARELGIPAVVSIKGLTSWLRDGDLVELDGARGVVRRIACKDGHDQ
jgi:pyruvate,water dikinase